MPHGYSKDHRPDGNLEESVYERVENAGEGDKEGRSRKNRWRTRYGISSIMSFTTRKTH